MFGGFGSTAGGFNSGQQQQQQQQQQQPGGGLFGAAPNTFGAPGAFGAAPQGQAAPGGFGGFGVNTSFGAAARPAFGQAQSATTAAPGGMFGAAPQPATSFGFGAPQQQQQQQPAGLFGAPAQQPAASGFGAPAATSFGFGAQQQQAQTPSFGAPGQTTPTNNFGTGNPSYQVTQEREASGTSLSAGAVSNFISISTMPNYKNWNFEELRVQDYAMGKKFSSAGGPGMGQATGAFGAPASTGFGGASSFGAAAAPTGGLFGQAQPAQQNTGFGFGAATAQPAAGGMFGAPSAAAPSLFGGNTGGFGAPAAATPAFGAPAAATSGFSFGSTASNTAPKTGFGAFGSAAAAPSAFGQQPAATGAFGAAPATNAFGQPQQPQQTAGAFGSAAGGGLFGAKPASTSPFGAQQTNTLGGGFGSALGANNAATGAFGAPAGAATSNAFASPFGAAAPASNLFGAAQPAAQANPFGMGAAAAPAAGGGLFGSATPAASTGGFGASLGGFGAAAKPATPGGGGLFGAAQPAATTGGFGGFGASTPAPAAGGGMFGSSFGAAATPAPTATGGFGSSLGGGFGLSLGGAATPAAGGSLFGGGGASMFNQSMGSTAQQQQQQPQASLQAGIDRTPYGNNPLFNTSAAAPANGSVSQQQQHPALFAAPEAAEKKPALLPHYKMTPKSASKIKLRGFTPAKPSSEFFSSGLSSVVNGSSGNGAVSSPAGLPKSVLGMLKDDGTDSLSGAGMPGVFKPRVKKLVITDDGVESAGASNGHLVTSTPARGGSGGVGMPGSSQSVNRVRFMDEKDAARTPVIDVTRSTRKPSVAAIAATGTPVAAPAFASGSSSSTSKSPKSRGTPTTAAPSSPQKTPATYETEPSLSELLQLSDAELTRVEGYTVLLADVGKVRFLEPVNLLQASPTGNRAGIKHIPGTVVVLKHKVIEVYPDETNKDPVGMGVNVCAEVSLDRCWVLDKATGMIVDDEMDPRFDRHFKKLERMEGTKMIGFNRATGTWRFRVEHFSRYGLDDESDDEEEGDGVVGMVNTVPAFSDELEIEDDEEEEEDDDESMSFAGNDSFAFVKSRKVVAAGGGGAKKVADLRKVAAMNRMMRQQQQVVAQQQQSILDDAFESVSEEEEEGEYEEQEAEVFVDEEEEEVYEMEEEVYAVSSGSEEFEEEQLEMEGDVTIMEQDEEEMEEDLDEEDEPESPPRNVMAQSVVAPPESSRRISMMRASLFRAEKPVEKSFGASSVFGRGSAVDSTAAHSKRGRDSMMNAGFLDGLSDGKLNTLNVEQEFQSPVKVKKTATETFAASMFAPAPAAVVSSLVQSTKPDEHVVPSPAVMPVALKEMTLPVTSMSDRDGNTLAVPPLQDSIVDGREGHCVDAGLFMGRSFRVGWGPEGKFVVAGRYAEESDTRLKESLAEAERYRHVKSLETILDGTVMAVTHPTGPKTSHHEQDRTLVADSYQPSKSILQTSVAVAPVCPIALIDKSFDFSTLALKGRQANQTAPRTHWTPTVGASLNDPRRAFTQTELAVWTLASALFDATELPAETVEEEAVVAALKASLQKEAVSNWLRGVIMDSGVVAGDGVEGVYTHLVARRVAEAVKVAVGGRDLRLATLVAQVGGVGAAVRVSGGDQSGDVGRSCGHGVTSRSCTNVAMREDVVRQVEVWQKQGTRVPAGYMKVWRLLGGDVGVWDKEVVGGCVDWKQTFGLFLWYAEGGALSLGEAVRGYDLAWGSEGGGGAGSRVCGKRPAPWYLERKRSSGGEVKDVSYNLLKLHTDSEYLLEHALLPSTVGPNLLDHRVSWLLWVVLSRAKHLREFAQHGNPVKIRKQAGRGGAGRMDLDGDEGGDEEEEDVTVFVSKTADACTASLCATLQSLGLWQWALFVGTFLSTQNGRECMVKDVLARFYPLSDTSASVATQWGGHAVLSAEWKFVVSKLKIPAVWLHEAKALRAKYNGNVLQECISLIDAQKFNVAHQLIVALLCPMDLINDSFVQIKNLLSEIPATQSQVENWNLGGGLILSYIDTMQRIRPQLQESGSMSHADSLRNVAVPQCLELLRGILLAKNKSEWMTSSLGIRMTKEAVDSIKQEWSVCLCEMAAKLVQIVHKIELGLGMKENQIPGDLLSGLPLTEEVRARYAANAIERVWFGGLGV
ncbi:hypothetical protein HDU98_008055 [Podochytrium sp. JEL0797]|nr:hypothetical protein HDU98_008055 [Podochytrium sp. JEL0797]